MPPTGGVRRLHQLQQKMVSPQLGFPHRAGGIVRGDNSFRLPSIGVVDTRKGFCSEDGIIRILPGCRWLHEPQPISNQPVGLGFPHRAGRYRPGEPPFLSLDWWSCRYMEGFMIWGWHFILSGCRWLYALGFPHSAGRYRPGDHRSCPGFGGVVDVRKDL